MQTRAEYLTHTGIVSHEQHTVLAARSHIDVRYIIYKYAASTLYTTHHVINVVLSVLLYS